MPSPIFLTVLSSVNLTPGDSGRPLGSCFTIACRYWSIMPVRHARSQLPVPAGRSDGVPPPPGRVVVVRPGRPGRLHAIVTSSNALHRSAILRIVIPPLVDLPPEHQRDSLVLDTAPYPGRGGDAE